MYADVRWESDALLFRSADCSNTWIGLCAAHVENPNVRKGVTEKKRRAKSDLNGRFVKLTTHSHLVSLRMSGALPYIYKYNLPVSNTFRSLDLVFFYRFMDLA